MVSDRDLHTYHGNQHFHAGIRAPRTTRNASDKSEPYGSESAEFATRRYMQRDVEVEVDTVDKSGSFIGALYVNKTENAAITLVKEGLASVHSFSAEGLSWSRQLYDAEASCHISNPCCALHDHCRVRPNKPSVTLDQLHSICANCTEAPHRFGKSTMKTPKKQQRRRQPMTMRLP